MLSSSTGNPKLHDRSICIAYYSWPRSFGNDPRYNSRRNPWLDRYHADRPVTPLDLFNGTGERAGSTGGDVCRGSKWRTNQCNPPPHAWHTSGNHDDSGRISDGNIWTTRARALGLGVGASLFGGLISWLALWQLSEPMADLSTKLGPFELFSLVILALAMLAGIGDSTPARGLLAGCLGVLVAMPGMHPASGELRWTFGLTFMNEGFRLIPVLIGMFAIGKILQDVTFKDGKVEEVSGNDSAWISLSVWVSNLFNLIRSSVIGTFIGILPGIGANIGSLAAYMAAKRASKKPERFGKGSEEGIIASEAANNATVGGALIPLISLGIPGSVIGAVLLGALIVHGLQPGPLLFRQNPEPIHAIIGTVLIANIMMFLIMVGCAKWIAKLSAIPKKILFPSVTLCCIWGAYALNGMWFDVMVMLLFGILGWRMEKAKLPLAAFVIGFVLAPIAEENLCAGLMASGGSYLPLITRPLSLCLLVGSVALILWKRKPKRTKN